MNETVGGQPRPRETHTLAECMDPAVCPQHAASDQEWVEFVDDRHIRDRLREGPFHSELLPPVSVADDELDVAAISIPFKKLPSALYIRGKMPGDKDE